ncbi:MAG: GntR family transcriptional regulator [Hyphomicrobiales bacterium]|nr:GntR family transcriptional regulator [Hyphomicrobiales bacterium]
MSEPDTSGAEKAEFRPLYAQIEAQMTRRIGEGVWRPGELLPTEFELAAEFGVSQGTVRKALIALEADKLIVRRQGVGTFVARHESGAALFHFFRMTRADGTRVTPRSRLLRQGVVAATREQARQLAVRPGARLHEILRLRSIERRPAIYERIFTPVALVPSLALPRNGEMEEEMYVIYQERYGILIARAAEMLRATIATTAEARALGLDAGAPLLEISRVAHDVNGRPVELRISRCDTRIWRYQADVY